MAEIYFENYKTELYIEQAKNAIVSIIETMSISEQIELQNTIATELEGSCYERDIHFIYRMSQSTIQTIINEFSIEHIAAMLRWGYINYEHEYLLYIVNNKTGKKELLSIAENEIDSYYMPSEMAENIIEYVIVTGNPIIDGITKGLETVYTILIDDII